MCPSNVREDSINGLSRECGAERIGVWNLLADAAKPQQSVTKRIPNDRFRMTSHWECLVAEWCLPRTTRRRGCCEPSSIEVVRVRGYTRSQLFRPAPLRTMRWYNDLWYFKKKLWGKCTWVLHQELRDGETSFSS